LLPRLGNSSQDGQSIGMQYDVITHSEKMVAWFLISHDKERVRDSSTSFASQRVSSMLYCKTFYIAE